MRSLIALATILCLMLTFVGSAYAENASVEPTAVQSVADIHMPELKVGRFLIDTQVDEWVRSLPPHARGEFGKWIAAARQAYKERNLPLGLFVFNSEQEYQEFLATCPSNFAELVKQNASANPSPKTDDSTVVAVLATYQYCSTCGIVTPGEVRNVFINWALEEIWKLVLEGVKAFICIQGHINYVGPTYDKPVMCPYCGFNGRLTMLQYGIYQAMVGCYCGEQFYVYP